MAPPVTPPELPKTGAGDNLLSALGLGALVTAGAAYIASRKNSLIGQYETDRSKFYTLRRQFQSNKPLPRGGVFVYHHACAFICYIAYVIDFCLHS